MKFKSVDIDMLHGPLTKSLLLFTLPIALSSILQQLFNAADTAVVGYFGNQDALAAVGTNTEIIALVVTLSSRLSVGINLLVANLIGKGKKEEIPAAIYTAVALAVIIGVSGLALGQAAAQPLLRMIKTPDAILSSATLYLRIYMPGYPSLLLYDFGSAVLRARGNSRYPFVVLALSGIANVGLNVLLWSHSAWGWQALLPRQVFPTCWRYWSSYGGCQKKHGLMQSRVGRTSPCELWEKC